ncbi:hypothetical protein HZH66_013789 [Vespula vulgaris]|uniref:Uncharacterized protein n=1 Tax=Vespula vulgaris TaxID=7454 RepID=A0A834MQX4_VESVU|nr:hypothetical protein HZH66_013789 [Vespula vulgaris]
MEALDRPSFTIRFLTGALHQHELIPRLFVDKRVKREEPHCYWTTMKIETKEMATTISPKGLTHVIDRVFRNVGFAPVTFFGVDSILAGMAIVKSYSLYRIS